MTCYEREKERIAFCSLTSRPTVRLVIVVSTLQTHSLLWTSLISPVSSSFIPRPSLSLSSTCYLYRTFTTYTPSLA